MLDETRQILDNALALPPGEKAILVDQLLASLDRPDEAIDALWRSEAEDRILGFREGLIKTVTLEQVLAKYRR